MPRSLMLLAVAVGFLIDCLIGDPVTLPHPVVFIGRLISRTEKYLRKRIPKTDKAEFWAGALLTAVVVMTTFAVSAVILWAASMVSKWLCFAISCIFCWQCFAARCLRDEAMKVKATLDTGDLLLARNQIAMLVGRDTAELTEVQVAKATIETVAENTSDGVIAPLFWMIIFGPVGGLVYKSVNTMDSMIGYKNDRYIFFGRCAAKLDDAVNYLPARLSGFGMIAAAFLTGFDGNNALRIWRRDRRKHASPNSAQTESVCAGALHIQLAGNASYFGHVHEKPFLGDPDRPVEAEDITRSCRLMYGTSVLLLAVFEIIAILCTWLPG